MMSDLRVRDLPPSERPRERLLEHGVEALTVPELVACVLGRGTAGASVLSVAHAVVSSCGAVEELAGMSVEQLAAISGMGQAKAMQLRAACELGRRATLAHTARGEPVTSPEAAVQWLAPRLVHYAQERFVAVLLDARHRVIRTVEISRGSISASLVHPREVFREAIAAGATALLVAHNHPSGDPTPSDEDVALTQRLVAAGALVGIAVLDHLIVASGGGLSLRQTGWIADEAGA